MSARVGGARLKRIGRKVVSWRSLGATVYNYIDRRTGVAKRRAQRFSSSPMLQMMERISVSEVQWRDAESDFARPEYLRLCWTHYSKLQRRTTTVTTGRIERMARA